MVTSSAEPRVGHDRKYLQQQHAKEMQLYAWGACSAPPTARMHR